MEEYEFKHYLEKEILEAKQRVERAAEVASWLFAGTNVLQNLKPIDLQAASTLYRTMGESLTLLRFYNRLFPHDKSLALQRKWEGSFATAERVWHSMLEDLAKEYPADHK